MRDTELYRHLLGLLEPWTVDRVALNEAEGRLDVWGSPSGGHHVALPRMRLYRPGSGSCRGTHLAAFGQLPFQTFLHARIPRVTCPTHHVRQVAGPLGGTGLALYPPV